MHFKLYQGYVTNSNAILKKLQEMNGKGQNRTQEFAGLKRMLGWEFDGMLLHEYYFENLGSTPPLSIEDPLMKQIEQNFGGFEAWKNDFTATGAIRGIGLVVTYVEPKQGRLINEWINEHDLGHLAGATPVGVEVHEDRDLGLGDDTFEVVAGDLHGTVEEKRLAALAASRTVIGTCHVHSIQLQAEGATQGRGAGVMTFGSAIFHRESPSTAVGVHGPDDDTI